MLTVVFSLVSLGAHLAVARWLASVSPTLRARPRTTYGVAVALACAVVAARTLVHLTEHGAARWLLGVALLELALVLLVVGPLTVVHLSGRVGAWIASARATAPRAIGAPSEGERAIDAGPAGGELELSRRQVLERTAGFAVLAGSASVLGWGAVRGRLDFALDEIVVPIAGLPKALDGYTIVQVSDVHVGAFVRDAELAHGLSLARSARPDLVVATGDLVDYDPAEAPRLARALADLPARDGACVVVGNHDHYAGVGGVEAAMRAAGVRVLVNEAIVLRPGDGGGFALLGVDDYRGREGGRGPDLARALAQAPPDRARILLAHQPRYFAEAAGRVALQLSGHTHGGQINPGLRPADWFMRYVAGRYERDGSTLYVNRGFGTAGPPSRVGARPEITRVVLVAA